MADTATKVRLDALEKEQELHRQRIHDALNMAQANEFKITALEADQKGLIDWKEYRTQVLIWLTVTVMGGIVVALIFYAKAHV